jgi:hypothetical protein
VVAVQQGAGLVGYLGGMVRTGFGCRRGMVRTGFGCRRGMVRTGFGCRQKGGGARPASILLIKVSAVLQRLTGRW